MATEIKEQRAHRACRLLPMAWESVWGRIPASAKAKLTSRELAELASALNAHWHEAMAFAEREAVGNGMLYHRGTVYNLIREEGR